MSSVNHIRVLALTLTVLVTVANLRICVAQESEPTELDPVLAKEKFEEGLAKIRNQEYQAALEAFEASYCHKPKAVVIFNIAMCEKALYKYAEALASFKKYLKEAGDSPKPDHRDLSRAAILEIEQLVGKVRVSGAPDGAKIYFDDVFIGTTPLDQLIAVNPGRYIARVVPKEGEPFETIVAVVAGAEVTLNANLKIIAPKDKPKGPGDSPPQETKRGFFYVGKITAVTLGLAAGIVGVVYTFKGQDAYNRGVRMVDSGGILPGDYVNQWDIDEYNSLREKLPGYQTGMIVSYSIAAVFLGTGAVFAVIDAKKARSRDSGVSLRMSPGGIIGEF